MTHDGEALTTIFWEFSGFHNENTSKKKREIFAYCCKSFVKRLEPKDRYTFEHICKAVENMIKEDISRI